MASVTGISARLTRATATHETSGERDIGARLDRLPATRQIWRLVALLAFGAFFEIYDLGLSAPLGLGLTTVGIFHHGGAGLFGLTDQATFIASTFAGLYIGSIGFSAVADRMGRRPIFTLALLWYSAATIIMGLQNTAVSVDFWRFVASLGAGLEMVAIDCYLAELTPRKIRGKAFAICGSIQYLSAPLVGVLAWQLIPRDVLGVAGWRWLTFFPALGALLVWWVRRELPESPRWLAAHGRYAEADKVLLEIEEKVAEQIKSGALPPPEPADPLRSPANPVRSGYTVLWSRPLRRRTLALVIFHLFQTIGYFGFSSWLPTLLVSQGVAVTKSLGYAATLAVIAPLAPLAFSLVADKLERKWLIVTGASVSAIFGLLMTTMTQHSNMLLFVAIGGMVAVGNSLMSLAYHTYQSEVFPTSVRARAVGFVYSFSRLSALLSSFLIAAVLDHAGSGGVFALISAAMVIVAVVIAALGPRTRGLSLDEI